MKNKGLVVAACFAFWASGASVVPVSAQQLGHNGTAAERNTQGDIREPSFSDQESRGKARRDFASEWANEVDAYPELISILADRRANALLEQKREWQEAVEDFGGSECVSCVSREYSEDWEVMANTPRFLSLGLERYVYMGGAHGVSGFDALIWDKQSSAAMRPIDLFVDPVALENVAFGDYCGDLHKQRSKRRGLDPAKGSKFDNCPSVSKLVISVSAYGGEKLDRVEFLAAPYVAGPYVEGSYQMTLPVTAQMLEIIKPEYRGAFAAGS